MHLPTSLHTWQRQSDPLVLKCPTHSPISPPCKSHKTRDQTTFSFVQTWWQKKASVHETEHQFVCLLSFTTSFLSFPHSKLLALWHISLPDPHCFSASVETWRKHWAGMTCHLWDNERELLDIYTMWTHTESQATSMLLFNIHTLSLSLLLYWHDVEKIYVCTLVHNKCAIKHIYYRKWG